MIRLTLQRESKLFCFRGHWPQDTVKKNDRLTKEESEIVFLFKSPKVRDLFFSFHNHEYVSLSRPSSNVSTRDFFIVKARVSSRLRKEPSILLSYQRNVQR